MIGPFDTLELERDGAWLTVWFNEPARRNPLSQARVDDLLALCAQLPGSGLRGVVFRGQGGVFCAGGDLALFRAIAAGTLAEAQIEEISRTGAQLFDAIAALPLLTVSVAEGAAMAGGVGLLCASDVVIAESGCRIALSEVRLGLVAAQIAPFVVARIGAAPARRLMLLGAPVEAPEAQALGLVDQVVQAPQIGAALAQIRADLALAAPGALAATKSLLAALPAQSRAQQTRSAAQVFAQAVAAPEGREGLASFAKKRPPKWSQEPC